MPESIHSRGNRIKILLHMLPHVAFEGWTLSALELAVVDAGFSKDDCHRAFDGHPNKAVEFFFEWINYVTEQQLMDVDNNINNMKVRNRIEYAILIRLRLLASYKEALIKTMQWLANPVRVPLGLKYLYQSVDSIWYAIGDNSVDFSFYTKRASLAAVYSATVVKWLTDHTVDYQETQKFLTNRLENVMQFHRFKHKIKSLPIFNLSARKD